MNKLKLLIVPLLILLLTGCGESTDTSEYDKGTFDAYYIYVDKETCVEYFVSNGGYNMGNFNLRYNQDGTLKTNKKCLKDKGEEE